MKIRRTNFHMFYQNKPITVSVKVISGFQSFLDHLQTNSLVFNEQLVVLFFFSLQCFSTFSIMIKQRTIRIQMEILFWVHSTSVQNRSIPFIFSSDTPLFSVFQISIGVIVEILSFLPSVLLVQFFRRIRSRPHKQQQMTPLVQAIHHIKQQSLP